jgi:hypothetical protein
MFDHLESLGKRKYESRLRVFIAACCRRIANLFPNAERRECLDTVDQWAMGRASVTTVRRAIYKALQGWDPESEAAIVPRENVADALLWLLEFKKDPIHAARIVAMRCREGVRAAGGSYDEEASAQASLLREIVGNPFQWGKKRRPGNKSKKAKGT